MLTLEKNQYENFIFQLKYRGYERNVMVLNSLLQKDLYKFQLRYFVIRCILFFNLRKKCKNANFFVLIRSTNFVIKI